jgi:asparagine synthase (glutamine-hydrolysing)
MCGIAGILALDDTRRHPGLAAAKAGAMATTMSHRGPDDTGVWESPDGDIALSHRRLAIIDLSPLGRNPMSWAGGALQITFNGEIYNFHELRQELEASGYRFRSQTDTEVILAAYDRWGLDAVDRFVGMFAFALWDASRRRLWLVRDRLGKKPLYYATYGGTVRFASELKAIVSDQQFPRDVDPAGLRMYLRYGYVPSPQTIYAAARKLPPAHYAVWENGSLRVTRYWDPIARALGARRNITEREAEAELESRLGVAVRQRLIADVPLGAFLSGGIDSSLVVALMKEQTAERVRTFTIRFEKAEFNEADHAAAVARHLGTEHSEETCDSRRMLDVVDRLADMFDEPFADSSAIPTYLVSAIARERVTVALSGDGGDELFFGYPRYSHYADRSWVLALPGPIRRAAAGAMSKAPRRRIRRIGDVLRSDEKDRYARFISWFSPDEVTALTGTPPEEGALYADAFARLDELPSNERPPLLDLVSYLPEDILTKVDRTSMASSLEVRAPLLDHRVVELAVGLPSALKRRAGSTKWLLRKLLYKRVPPALVERPKMGFGVPLADWFRGPLRERMSDFCAGDDAEALGIDGKAVRQLWTDFIAGDGYRTELLWLLYSLIAWSRRFQIAPIAPVL